MCNFPKATKEHIKCRKISEINRDLFRRGILNSDLLHCLSEDPSNLAETLNHVLCELLDKHAPEQCIPVFTRPSAPWFNDVREAKRKRRRAERKLMKSHLEIDRQLYEQQCNSYNQLLMKSKSHYLSSKIEQSNTKQLFQFVNKLTAPTSNQAVADSESDQQLADDFEQFFLKKVQGIVSSLGGSPLPTDVVSPCNSSFIDFDPVSEDAVRKTILESPTTLPLYSRNASTNLFHLSQNLSTNH